MKTVGLQYFEARLGRWTDVMGCINRELEAEQAETLGISAAEWGCCAPCANSPAGM